MGVNGKANDPAEFFKQYCGGMEESWSKIWNEFLSSPAYAQASGSMMDAFLSSQQAVQSNLKKTLENLNIPSKDDVARVAFQVVQTEQKVSEVQKELRQLQSLEAKLDLVLTEIKSLKQIKTTVDKPIAQQKTSASRSAKTKAD